MRALNFNFTDIYIIIVLVIELDLPMEEALEVFCDRTSLRILLVIEKPCFIQLTSWTC